MLVDRQMARQVPQNRQVFWLGKTSDWCVLIPVINEGERIAKLLERMAQNGISDSADVLIVDGGSTDGSLNESLLKRHAVRGLIVKTGEGRLSAQLRCGYSFVLDEGYKGVITIDGNNKDDPAAIPAFIDALRSGCDFVQASRFVEGGLGENTPKLRELAIRCIHAPLLSFFSGFRWTDTTQGFRGYSSRMLADPNLSIFRDVFDSYELLVYLSYRAPRLGYRCVELPTARRYPVAGKTPTKITGVRGNWMLLQSLIRACRAKYNP